MGRRECRRRDSPLVIGRRTLNAEQQRIELNGLAFISLHAFSLAPSIFLYLRVFLCMCVCMDACVSAYPYMQCVHFPLFCHSCFCVSEKCVVLRRTLGAPRCSPVPTRGEGGSAPQLIIMHLLIICA